MKAFRALLGLSFKSLLLTTFNMGRGKKKKKAASGIAALLLLCGLMVYLSGMYSFMMAQAFAGEGGLDIMMMIISIMALVFPFIYVVYASQSLVFSTKDVDLVLSLPVSSFSVMLARVLALYLESLLMVEMMLIPAAAAYLVYGGAGGAGFVILVLLVGALLALVPTLLALVFGTVISLIISRMRFKNLFNIIFSILLMGLILVGSFSISFTASSSMGSADANLVNGLRSSLVGSMPFLKWIFDAFTGHIPSLLLVAALTILPFLGITWLFSRFYKSMLTRLSSHHLRTDYKLRNLKAGGSFSAMFYKESRRFFGTPGLVLNSGVGIIMALIMCVAALFFKSEIAVFLGEAAGMGGEEVYTFISPMLLAVICFFGSMVYVSAVSISLEGKTLWILKEAPLSTGKIFAAKAGFNFVLCAFTILVCTPLLAIAFSLPLADVGIMILLGLLFSGVVSTLGLMINLWFPRMDAENETIVIKQSASVILAMLANWVVFAGLILLYVFGPNWSFMIFGVVGGAILLVLNALLIFLLNTAGRKLFAKL